MRRKEYREKLAEEFARLLEEKELDWKKEWGGRDIPFNAKTGSVYKGSNRFYLSLIAAQRGYKDPRWATFRQIQAEGWRLKNAKGQGVYVEYWYPYDIKEGKNLTWQEFYKLRDGIGDRYQLRSRYFVVFNASLIDGITPYTPEKKDIPVDELVNTLSRSMDVEIRNDGGDRAYYSPSEDKIHLPIPSDFNSSYAYNSTALHELTHATGAAHRLNRNMGGIFGSQEYAFEELVAEISSCFMSSYLEIDQDEKHIENHKAYVQSWINVIREKPEALSQAIKQAERATAYMEYKAELIPKETYNEVSRSAPNVDEKLLDTPQPDAEVPEKERIYHLDEEKYLSIKSSDTGYDYKLYDHWLESIAEGSISNTELSYESACDEIFRSQGLSAAKLEQIQADEFKRISGMLDSEPMVTIDFTESDQFQEGERIPFSEADKRFEEIDKKTRELYGTEGRYDKTYFTIEYVEYGRLRSYSGRQDFGDLDGTLVSHILEHATYYRNDADYQSYLAAQGEQEKANEIYDDTIHDFVPYLKMHNNLSQIEKEISAVSRETSQALDRTKGEVNDLIRENIDYCTVMQNYVRDCRIELNTASVVRFSRKPEMKYYSREELIEYEETEAYKAQVEQELAQEAASYGMTIEEYAANGYEPLETVETVIEETRDGLSRLYGDNHYLQDIITIHEYEQSIRRDKSIIGDMDEAQISEYARKCQAYLDFGRQVDNCLEGKTQMREALQVCMTPDIMQQTGFHAIPMHMTQKHLRDCMREKDDSQPHYHGLTIDEIKRLPEELEKPAVLAQSLSREDSVIAILGYREKDGLPVIVSVVPNGKATYHLERVDSNFITSVYGKEQIQEYVQRFIENERMLYINKEKSQELALLPLRLRQDHPAPVFDTIIKRINEPVKEGQAESVIRNAKGIQPEVEVAPKI